jgi:hypothetical protein
MSKEYRDTKRRGGVQAVHHHRGVHQLSDVIPLNELMREVNHYSGEADHDRV